MRSEAGDFDGCQGKTELASQGGGERGNVPQGVWLDLLGALWALYFIGLRSAEALCLKSLSA